MLFAMLPTHVNVLNKIGHKTPRVQRGLEIQNKVLETMSVVYTMNSVVQKNVKGFKRSQQNA